MKSKKLVRFVFVCLVFIGVAVPTFAQSNVDSLVAKAYAAGRLSDYSVACVVMGEVFFILNNNFAGPVDPKSVPKDSGKWQNSGKTWCEQAMEKEKLCEPGKVGRANEICAPAADYNSCIQRLGANGCSAYKKRDLKEIEYASSYLGWSPGTFTRFYKPSTRPKLGNYTITDENGFLTLEPAFWSDPFTWIEIKTSINSGNGNPLDKYPKNPGKIYPIWVDWDEKYKQPPGFLKQWNEFLADRDKK